MGSARLASADELKLVCGLTAYFAETGIIFTGISGGTIYPKIFVAEGKMGAVAVVSGKRQNSNLFRGSQIQKLVTGLKSKEQT